MAFDQQKLSDWQYIKRASNYHNIIYRNDGKSTEINSHRMNIARKDKLNNTLTRSINMKSNNDIIKGNPVIAHKTQT